jgi:SAM-dependent methyltransferase
MADITRQNQRWFAGKIAKWPQFWNRMGYTKVPQLVGRTLLDVGAGLGGNSYAAAKYGAIVTALEPDSLSHQLSKELILQRNSDIIGSIEFENTTVEEFDCPTKFDYIICDEVFEHLLDFESAINKMASLLTPGGVICSGWGPLWRSPIGGHELSLSLVFQKGLPKLTTKPNSFFGLRLRLLYSHRFWTNKGLEIYCRERNLPRTTSIQELGLNGMSVADFSELIDSSNLIIDRWSENVGNRFAYKILRVLCHLPGFHEAFSSNVYAVLRRP